MQGQKLLLLALMAGLLILQLSPPVLARTSSTGSESTESESTESESTEEDSTDSDPAQCLISIFNFLIGQVNTLIPAIGLGFAACEVPCGATATTGACIACIASVIPTIPMVPTLDGCS